MSLFGKSSPESFLGVDIGASGIKMVELQNEGGRAKLLTYAYTNRGPTVLEKNVLDDPAAAGALIKSMAAKAKAKSTRAVAAVPTAHVFSSIISVQASGEKDVKAAVEVQARKLVPLPLEQMYLDSKVLEKKDKFTTVLLTGAVGTLVQQYMKSFQAAGLKLSSLEPEAFALVRSLVGKDLAPIAIVDVGGLRTNIIIVEKGVPYLSRSIAVGGINATKAVAPAAGGSLEEAERMKIDATTAAPFEQILQTLANETKYLTQSYSTGQNGKPVEKIVLTGGSARLPELAERLTAVVGIKAYLGDPWARVIYPADLRPLLEDLGPRFAVAVGLAMRDIT